MKFIHIKLEEVNGNLKNNFSPKEGVLVNKPLTQIRTKTASFALSKPDFTLIKQKMGQLSGFINSSFYISILICINENNF
jgi:hypothetical protein